MFTYVSWHPICSWTAWWRMLLCKMECGHIYYSCTSYSTASCLCCSVFIHLLLPRSFMSCQTWRPGLRLLLVEYRSSYQCLSVHDDISLFVTWEMDSWANGGCYSASKHEWSTHLVVLRSMQDCCCYVWTFMFVCMCAEVYFGELPVCLCEWVKVYLKDGLLLAQNLLFLHECVHDSSV